MTDEAPAMIEALKKVIKRMHYPSEVMLTCVRWYAAYPLSLRHIEEMMQERGVCVDHATIHRWAMKILPVLAAVFRRRKHQVGESWRMDETYVKVAGQWKYLYRAVDRNGDTVDFLLRTKRDHAAARQFLERAIGLHRVPEKITIDKSGANTAAILSVNADSGTDIALRQSKNLNNIVEQAHRTIKRIARPNARVQVIPIRASAVCRHRDDAHDQEESARFPSRPQLVRSIEVLLFGLLNSRRRPEFTGLRVATATEPQSKYLNNLVEQDHRAVKRRVRRMMEFKSKSFRSAARLIAGIETMHMIKKNPRPAAALTGLTSR